MDYLPTVYQQFIFKSRYARWLPEQKRREEWRETICRYFDFFETHLKDTCSYTLKKDERKQLEDAILTLQVMPSMRCLMTAGDALERDLCAAYNCSFIAIDSPRSFDEILYILTCFHPNTEVITISGVKKICELVANKDLVLSFDTVTEKFEYVAPSIVIENNTENIEKIELIFENDCKIVCTHNHLFLTKNRGWVEAEYLLESDDVLFYGEIEA